MRKEGKVSKKASKAAASASSSNSDESVTKRKDPLAPWRAFAKHVIETQPERFIDMKLQKEKMVVVSAIKKESMENYNTFVENWKASQVVGDTASPVQKVEPVMKVAEPVQKVAEPVQKVAEPVQKVEPVQKTASPLTPPPKVKTADEKKAEIKAKAAEKKAKKTEEQQMASIEIDGVTYWHEPATNALWEKTGDNFADGRVWTGYYQPGSLETIRYTDAYGAE
jgi:hypothetical protein